ncbi:MAG: hypothetical protein ACC649_03735 [Myxococcota bacterium]
MGKLPTTKAPMGAAVEAVANYIELLDRVLEDRVVTDDELADLASLAHEWNLGRDQLEEINLSYMRSLVAVALANDVVTEAERRDLDRGWTYNPQKCVEEVGHPGGCRSRNPVREGQEGPRVRNSHHRGASFLAANWDHD